MIKKLSLLLILVLVSSLQAETVAAVAGRELKKVHPGSITLRAENGFLYSRNELTHLAKGELAGGKIVKVAAAKKRINANPVPAITEFDKSLKELGINLIVVPVPPKMAVYPLGGLKPGDAAGYLRPLYDELRQNGVEVLDLTDIFVKNSQLSIYCRTDAHWGSDGITIAAEELTKKISYRGTDQFTVHESKKMIIGDLQRSLDKNSKSGEEVILKSVAGKTLDPSSPILVLGDSHALFFSTGEDMLAENSGIVEHLAVNLNSGIDRIAIKGSAATTVRINLYRNALRDKKWLTDKKVVIWIFSCREFTEASSGFAKVPVCKK